MMLSALLSLVLSIQSNTADARLVLSQQTVRWNISVNADTGPWETAVLDADGRERFRVSVIPLWAVEGGVTAFEIALTSADKPGVNLLGTRRMGEAAAFVIEAAELERGIGRSTFGSKRSFGIPGSGGNLLEVTVLSSRLGKAAGMCDQCPNVQELRATLAIRTR
ncbi:MAG: hypothetical protein ABIT71_01420 [Vicinamibacteraceae bacterium]